MPLKFSSQVTESIESLLSVRVRRKLHALNVLSVTGIVPLYVSSAMTPRNVDRTGSTLYVLPFVCLTCDLNPSMHLLSTAAEENHGLH